MPLEDRQYLDRVLTDEVDDSVVAINHLSQVWNRALRYDSSG